MYLLIDWHIKYLALGTYYNILFYLDIIVVSLFSTMDLSSAYAETWIVIGLNFLFWFGVMTPAIANQY